MYGIVPNHNVGIGAIIPICESTSLHHSGIRFVPSGHVFKENKLKIAKHSSIPARMQGSAVGLSNKFPNGIATCHNDGLSTYASTLNKKRKAHEANLHTHDESTAPQMQCRYAPPTPVLIPQGTATRIGARAQLHASKYLQLSTECTPAMVSDNAHHFTNPPATAKACSKSSTAQGDYAIVVGELLRSSNESYEVLAFLGRGTFGQVVKCRCTSTKRCVAIKILKNLPSYLRQGNVEIQILQTLSQQDTESHNIVRAIECFQHKNHMCFVFELLEQNLYEYLKSNKFRPLSLLEIRPITQQVLTALSKLKSLGLIHADLKPENIMLVSSSTGIMRYRVKVIDFGSACHSSKAVQNTYLQSRYYRAPEILLGLPFNEAIDMWSLGCVIAELFLGWPLYPGSSEYDQMRYIVETQGLPPADLLQNAGKCNTFFVRDPYHGEWRMKTQEEYALETGQQAKEARKYFFTALNQICDVSGVPPLNDPDRELELEDRQQFASLLTLMLKMRPSDRVLPDSALLHPFITLLHLQTHPFSKRFHDSLTLMQVCHEATRRQHMQTSRTNLQQFNSLPSLHECSSSASFTASSGSPDNSVTRAILGQNISLSLPQAPIGHATESAVAYYAAAAVAAALTKPTSHQLTEERKLSDSNHLRTYKMPTETQQQQGTSLSGNAQYNYSTVAEPTAATLLLAQQKSDAFQEGQSNLINHTMSAPYSLSLYDLVAASGNALSLLNAVAAPVTSNLVAVSAPTHLRVAPQPRDSIYQFQQPISSKTDFDGQRPIEQAEEAALVLSSYLAQDHRQLRHQEPYISVNLAPAVNRSHALEQANLRDTLNAFVQQQQQQHFLHRNPAAALVAIQQHQHQQQQHQSHQHLAFSNQHSQEPIFITPSSADLGALRLANSYQTGIIPKSKPFAQCSISTAQQRLQIHQMKQRQNVLNFQNASTTRVVANPLLSAPRNQHDSNVVKPVYTVAVPLVNNLSGNYIQGLPQNYATLLQQQQQQQHTLLSQRLGQSNPRSASPPSSVKINQPVNNTEQSLPINLAASAELDDSHLHFSGHSVATSPTTVLATEFTGDCVTLPLQHSPSILRQRINLLSSREDSSQLSACWETCVQADNGEYTQTKPTESALRIITSIDAEHQSQENAQPIIITTNPISTSVDSEKSGILNNSDCKINPRGNLSTVSSASSLRSDKKIPVGRVQPMIKQEECPSSTCCLPSPTVNLSSGSFRNIVGANIYSEGSVQRCIPAHCLPRGLYQSGHGISRDCPSVVSGAANVSNIPKQPRISFSPNDTESQTAQHLSAAHAAAAAYHNLMYFQLQQQQQHLHRTQVSAVNFPTVSAIHLRPTHHCTAVQPTPVQIPIVNDAWSTSASSAPELDDSTAAAASYYAAAAAAAAAAVAQREQQQRQELELLLNQHSIHLHQTQLSTTNPHHHHHPLSSQLFRQQ